MLQRPDSSSLRQSFREQ